MSYATMLKRGLTSIVMMGAAMLISNTVGAQSRREVLPAGTVVPVRLDHEMGSKSKDTLKWVGIGAGGGLLISTLIKGNTLTSLLLGAGAGYLYSELQGKKATPGDVNLKEGSEFGVRFDRDLAFTTNSPRYYRRSDDTTLNPDYDRNNGNYDRWNRDNRDNWNGSDPQNRNYDRDTAYGNDITMMVNNRHVRFNNTNRPYSRNGVVLVPLALIGRAAHFNYRYDSANRTIYARDEDVSLGMGSRTAWVDGERRTVRAKAEMRNGLIFVPMQFIGWAANGTMDWNVDSHTITLTSNTI